MKNEKFSKFVLFLNQKTNYIFVTRLGLKKSLFPFRFNDENRMALSVHGL